jgi:hypothetical protein
MLWLPCGSPSSELSKSLASDRDRATSGLQRPSCCWCRYRVVLIFQLSKGLRRYSANLRSRSALVITVTELKVMAAAATMGLSSRPKSG